MKLLKKANIFLVIFPLLIFLLGIITLFSTEPSLAKNQLIFFAVGIMLYLFFLLVDYRIWTQFLKSFYIVIMGLMLTTFVFGQKFFGSARWLQFGEFNLQPSEFAKVVVVLLSAYLVATKPKSESWLNTLKTTALYFIPLIILVLLQPDLSTAIVLSLIILVVFWFSDINKAIFLVLFSAAGLFSTPFWSSLRDYQKERILVFLNPTLDVLGSGYNVIQSSIAIGSGGFLGRGFGRGTQSHLQFLPVFWTDFIFAAFAEEWGFIGVLIILFLYIALLVTLIFMISKIKESFGVLILVGVFTTIFIQFFVNVGMNLGIMPVTGIPLPLVSYGGSSLITSALLLGLAQSVWIHEKV